MVDEAMDGLGGLNGMVLNVGIGVGALGLDGVDLREWNDTLAVNLSGPMLWEGARRGIRANIICPGLVDTPLGRQTSAGRPSRSAAGVPAGRMATGWEIAYAALFFMSDESVYVNAQTLAVDSGITGL
jgi:NAD(P)-dependent dehydrogenase (short-subunit alcohol dehydrogenase family)